MKNPSNFSRPAGVLNVGMFNQLIKIVEIRKLLTKFNSLVQWN